MTFFFQENRDGESIQREKDRGAGNRGSEAHNVADSAAFFLSPGGERRSLILCRSTGKWKCAGHESDCKFFSADRRECVFVFYGKICLMLRS